GSGSGTSTMKWMVEPPEGSSFTASGRELAPGSITGDDAGEASGDCAGVAGEPAGSSAGGLAGPGVAGRPGSAGVETGIRPGSAGVRAGAAAVIRGNGIASRTNSASVALWLRRRGDLDMRFLELA